MADFTKQSARWAIYNEIATALENDGQLQGVKVVRNPRTAQHLGSGEQLVVIKWGSDSPTELNGNNEKRKFRVIVGGISRKREAPDADADALHLAAGDVVKRTLQSLNQLPGISQVKSIHEGDTTPDIDGIEVDGAIVLTTWEIDYKQRRAG